MCNVLKYSSIVGNYKCYRNLVLIELIKRGYTIKTAKNIIYSSKLDKKMRGRSAHIYMSEYNSKEWTEMILNEK